MVITQMFKDIFVAMLIVTLVIHAIWAVIDTLVCIRYKIKPAKITIITYIVVIIGFAYLYWYEVM